MVTAIPDPIDTFNKEFSFSKHDSVSNFYKYYWLYFKKLFLNLNF